MRNQDRVTFCGTIEYKGKMTDVYDTSEGTRITDGLTSREGMSEEALIEVLSDSSVRIFDWRES